LDTSQGPPRQVSVAFGQGLTGPVAEKLVQLQKIALGLEVLQAKRFRRAAWSRVN
jgi:hypothetical protein